MTTNVLPDAPGPQRRRPKIVDVDDLPTAFSSRGAAFHDGKGRGLAVPRIADGEHHAPAMPAAPPDAVHLSEPASAAADPQMSQRLVRYSRRVPAVAAEGADSPQPARRQPVRPLRSPRLSPRPDDLTEELLVVVADHLGFDVRAIARSMYGQDNVSSRARISSLLKGFGPRGKVMALRLASILLDRSAPTKALPRGNGSRE